MTNLACELIVLGTASQAPTRHRNHNGYAVRWDEELLVFDPGEGFQRQCLLARLTLSRATGCLITHFHGDHSLGLPGLLQRRVLDGAKTALPVWFPADGAEYLERLRTGTIWNDPVGLERHPVERDGVNGSVGKLEVFARHLDHRVTTVGYRIQEPDRVKVDAVRLSEVGVEGPDVGRLLREGSVSARGQTVALQDFSWVEPGQSMAFVMDTRLCENAFALAQGVDLLVCESTYLESERKLAHEYGHLTAAQAAQIASESGASRLVLTHFSQRHPDAEVFVREAREVHEDVVAAADLERITMPPRHGADEK